MRVVNPRYWAGLVFSLLLLSTFGAGAQAPRIISQNPPPPHIALCLETMNSYGNFLIMRRAGITHDEAVTAFDISIKLSRYLLKMQGQSLPPEKVVTQRAGVDLVYDLTDEVVANNAAVEAWMNDNMKACIADNAPPESTEPAPSNGNRMIPS